MTRTIDIDIGGTFTSGSSGQPGQVCGLLRLAAGFGQRRGRELRAVQKAEPAKSRRDLQQWIIAEAKIPITMNDIKRIVINTSGGDAPGLNAVIHAVVHAAHTHSWEVHGIRDGLDGLLHPENYPDGGVIKLTRPLVRNIAHLGGTILGTSNHGNPFKTRVPQPDGSFREIDRSDEVLRRFR